MNTSEVVTGAGNYTGQPKDKVRFVQDATNIIDLRIKAKRRSQNKMSDIHEGEVESWNMATATLKRLSFLLDKCSACAQSGDFVGWENALLDLRRKLYPFMEKDDFEWINQKFSSLPKNWILPNGKIDRQHYQKVYNTFDEVEMKFSEVMKLKGLLMPKPIDTGKAVTQM